MAFGSAKRPRGVAPFFQFAITCIIYIYIYIYILRIYIYIYRERESGERAQREIEREGGIGGGGIYSPIETEKYIKK